MRTEIEIDSDIQEFVPRFCESRKKDLENISNSLKTEDFTAIAKIAHVIKGVSRPYGFPGLEQLGVELEKGALAKDLSLCTRKFEEMNTYLQKYIKN